MALSRMAYNAASQPNTIDGQVAEFVFELLNSVTKVHIAHLQQHGAGAYAAHTAMGIFYDAVGDLADDVAECYQGATGRLLTYPITATFPSLASPEDCIGYLNSLYARATAIQQVMPYSDIVNEIDNIKKLINKSLYRLINLK